MDRKLKTKLFGFSRKDTLNYIESYQAECFEQINELKAQIEQLKKENDKIAEEKSTLQAAVDSAENELNVIRAQLEDEKKKTSENENVKNRVGEIFIDAKEHADEIVSAAKKGAEKIITTAQNQAKSTVDDIDATYLQLEQLRANMKTVFNDFCDRVENINGILRSAKTNISDNDTDAVGKIKYL